MKYAEHILFIHSALRNVRSPALMALDRWSGCNIGSPGPSASGAEHVVPGVLNVDECCSENSSFTRLVFGIYFGH